MPPGMPLPVSRTTEDDLRAFAVLDQRCCKLTVACVALGELLAERRVLDVFRPETTRHERRVELAHSVGQC